MAFCFGPKLSSCMYGGTNKPCILCSKLQEYFIRHIGGCILDTEFERTRLSQALVAAIERRASHVCPAKLIYYLSKTCISIC